MINDIVTKLGNKTTLYKVDLHNCQPVVLNEVCILVDMTMYVNARCDKGTLKGKFVSSCNEWVTFRAESGYLTCIDKWDLLVGNYMVKEVGWVD